MVKCPSCGEDIDITNIAPGKTIKCAKCGAKAEVIMEGKKKELLATDVEYDD